MKNIRARYGVSVLRAQHGLALALLLAGCSSEASLWRHWDKEWIGPEYSPDAPTFDERVLCSLRPGRTRLQDVEHLLGPQTQFARRHGSRADPDGITQRAWQFASHMWYLGFDGSETLVRIQRWEHLGFGIFSSDFPAEEFDRWVESRWKTPAVAAELAQDFVPGRTTPEEVAKVWGGCDHAHALESGRFLMRWGPNQDLWSLEFDADARLYAAPQHYRS